MKIDHEYIIKIRRELHENPEIAFDLEKTLSIIKRELDAMGICYTDRFGKSSLVATINPEQKGKVIAIRADIDALPITEETGLPFASKNPGKMHACGHDCHTAMLLGTGKALLAIKDQLRCQVRLFFQAAEEAAPGGASLMCKDGAMDDVDVILACHVNAAHKTGLVSINQTCMNASSHGFILDLYGKSSHVARPHLGVDAIAMASRVYQDIQIMRAREINPFSPCVVGIGEIHGGNTNNIVCDHVMMHGTIRTLDVELDSYIFRRIGEIADAVSRDMGGRYEIKTTKLYPAVHNTPQVVEDITRIAKALFGEDSVIEHPFSMGAEDFAFYLQHKPGAIFQIGAHKEGTEPYPLHNGKFNPDENALCVPPQIFVQYVLDHMED